MESRALVGIGGQWPTILPTWHAWLVIYDPVFFLAPSFQPIKSAAALDAAELAGDGTPGAEHDARTRSDEP